MKFHDPALLEGWLQPHSLEWYKQVGAKSGAYDYGWKSEIVEPNGETLFDEKVLATAKGKKVLDAGCGHGEFTKRCSYEARHITGFDATDAFLKTGEAAGIPNLDFVLANAKQNLPFEQGAFDFAYNRKGPTSAYLDLSRVVKKGGKVLGLHPGDGSQCELPLLFPGLFKETAGSPIKEQVESRLSAANFSSYQIEAVHEDEYLSTPADVLELLCFGQKDHILEQIRYAYLMEVEGIFNRHAHKKGLRVTHSRYLVEAIV